MSRSGADRLEGGRHGRRRRADSTPGADWPAEDLESLVACPVCLSRQRRLEYDGLTDRVSHCAPGKWTLWRCSDCASLYLDPRPSPASIDRAYGNYYTHHPGGSAEEPGHRGRVVGWWESLRNGLLNKKLGYHLTPASQLGAVIVPLFPNRAAWMQRVATHCPFPGDHSRLLDVGCGSGALVERLSALGWSASGIDPDEEAVSAARARGNDVTHGAVFDLERRVGPASFDAVTLDHSIEHMHDPLGALRAILLLLRPGGHVWIATPNASAASLRRWEGNWINLDPPRHLVLFSRDALIDSLRRIGFTNVAQKRAPTLAPTYSRQSAGVAAGRDPLNDPGPLPAGERFMARLLSLHARLKPRRADELIVLAEKPATQSDVGGAVGMSPVEAS